jgi:hypothetical protein
MGEKPLQSVESAVPIVIPPSLPSPHSCAKVQLGHGHEPHVGRALHARSAHERKVEAVKKSAIIDRMIGLVTALSLAVPYVPSATAQAQVSPRAAALSRADYEACQRSEIAGVEEAVRAITLEGLKAGTAGTDFDGLVAQAWRRVRMDDTLAAAIDASVESVRRETSWGDLVGSLVNQERAKEIAAEVARRTYDDAGVKKAIVEIAATVGKDVGQRIEFAAGDAAGPATRCMQAFLGPRYGSVVARVVGGDATREITVSGGEAATPGGGQVLLDNKEGIAGLVVLVVRRQLGNLAARIGQRVAGAVLSRLVAVVAGGVGIALIAKDIWELRNGVLPIIAEEMKARGTTEKVRAELARAISGQIEENLSEIADKAAERVIEVWREFRAAHARVLDLAERHAPVRALLDSVRPEHLARVDEVTALVLASEGEAGVLARTADGTLREAVDALPAEALEIARDMRSLGKALAWQRLAGRDLAKVVSLELHRRLEPEQLTREGLGRLLRVDDKGAIGALAALPPEARERLLELEPAALRALARALTGGQLAALSRYLRGLEAADGRRLLAAVVDRPPLMHRLSPMHVERAVLRSRDRSAALTMILTADDAIDPAALWQDVQRAVDGRIAPELLWERHPVAVAVLAGLVLLLLAALWRGLVGRRPPREVVEAAQAARRTAERARGAGTPPAESGRAT